MGKAKHYTGQPTEVVPFDLQTNSLKREKKRTLLTADLMFAAGKKVSISVQEGQDPREVARTYSQIYNLNERNQQLLESALEIPEMSVQEQISVQDDSTYKASLENSRNLASSKASVIIPEAKEEDESEKSRTKLEKSQFLSDSNNAYKRVKKRLQAK